MKKLWIYLAIVIAVIVVLTIAIHYLPVMYVITAGVSLILGAVAGIGGYLWYKSRKEV